MKKANQDADLGKPKVLVGNSPSSLRVAKRVMIDDAIRALAKIERLSDEELQLAYESETCRKTRKGILALKEARKRLLN